MVEFRKYLKGLVAIPKEIMVVYLGLWLSLADSLFPKLLFCKKKEDKENVYYLICRVIMRIWWDNLEKVLWEL